jgi:DNA-binding CsgD family transcriptional regulator
MILSLLKALVLPLLFDLQSQGGTISFQLIWLFSLVFLVDRYRFLLPYRDAEREAMMELSGYSLIIMDGKGHIQIMNREAERLLGEKVHPLYYLDLKHYIHPVETFFNEINDLQKAEDHHSFTCTVEILSKDNGRIPVDAKVSVLRDTLERRNSFLITLKEKEHISKLRSRFNLSDREVEVLQYLVNGFSNREIAEMMYIAEATVKSHVAHIFDKLGVDNRVRVILLLKEFGLISGQTSDKEVVIL